MVLSASLFCGYWSVLHRLVFFQTWFCDEEEQKYNLKSFLFLQQGSHRWNIVNFLNADATLSLHLPCLHLAKLHFVATVTLDQLLYNLRPWGKEEPAGGDTGRMKKVFKWRTLGLYRRWHGQGFPWQRRRQLWWRRRRRLGSWRRRWLCAGPWRCSTAPEGRSAGGRRPDGSAASSRCRRCGEWAARLSPECRQQGRKHMRIGTKRKKDKRKKQMEMVKPACSFNL